MNLTRKMLRRELAKERRKNTKINNSKDDDDYDNDNYNYNNTSNNNNDNNNDDTLPFIYSCHNLHVYGRKQQYNHNDNTNSDYNEKEITYPLLHHEAIEFYNEGFFVHRNAIDDMNIINNARRYIDENYYKFLKQSKRQDDWRIHFQQNLDLSNYNNLIEHLPILNLLLHSVKITDKLRDILGCKLGGIFYSQIALRTPVVIGNREEYYCSGAEYHIDGQANASGDRFPDPWSIQIGIALVDIMTEDMGNFTVFPKGHISRSWINYCEEKKNKTLPSLGPPHKVCLRAGDVVYVHCLLPHRGGKNTYELTLDDEQNKDDVVNHIPKKTREMVFIRIKGLDIDYEASDRSLNVINNPFYEFNYMLNKFSLT